MPLSKISYCPGTLSINNSTYSRTCLNKVFNGKKVHHILPYDSPLGKSIFGSEFENNQKRISLSGVQSKFSILLEKNKLRLTNEGERGEYILKPIPKDVINAGQMPANEHLTMQLAKQVFKIETAENALIFFRGGDPAYITKRFDINKDGSKSAQEDFACLAGKTPQTHGEHYKYLGNYFELFELLKKYVNAYIPESIKLFKLLIFNYLFSNGDAHLKNFSLIETPLKDFKLSPAYDLLNTKIHIDDSFFALKDGLLPKNIAEGPVRKQFKILGFKSDIREKLIDEVLLYMESQSQAVKRFISHSFLDEKTKKQYWQLYNFRLGRIKE